MTTTYILNLVAVLFLGSSVYRFLCIFLGVPLTGISGLKVPREKKIWLPILLVLDLSWLKLLKIAIITGWEQFVSDLSKIKLNLSCTSFLTHNLFCLLFHPTLLFP